MSESQQPTITLDSNNSIEILAQFVEIAQKHGSFVLAESDILKRCRDVLLRGLQDTEINVPSARNLFIQAVNKGQSKGAYTLDDASILHKVCQYVSQNLTSEQPQQQPQQPQPQQVLPLSQLAVDDDSLSTLSEPVPFKTSGPRVV
jgi:hypothetical protein